ncbi:MAG: phosphatase PAP2 family protein [Spirochaetaceae bacterium]
MGSRLREAALRRTTLEPIDLTFYGVNLFLAGVNLVVAAGAESTSRHVPAALGFVAACAVPGLLSLAWERLPARLKERLPGRAVRFLRVFYVHAFYGTYFAEVILLSQAVWGGASLDAPIAWVEEAIFGFQPALEFSERFAHLKPVNELLFLGYFSYYPILTTGFWVMYATGRHEAARRAVFIATTSFAVLYVWYVFVPVHGPKYFFAVLNERWYSEFEGYLAVPLMRMIFGNMNLAGAALPSSHVAIGLIALILLRPHVRGLYRVYLGLFVVLCVSTVYIYAHYAVDIVAGLAVVPLLLRFARSLYPPVRRLTTRTASSAPDGADGGRPGDPPERLTRP